MAGKGLSGSVRSGHYRNDCWGELVGVVVKPNLRLVFYTKYETARPATYTEDLADAFKTIKDIERRHGKDLLRVTLTNLQDAE